MKNKLPNKWLKVCEVIEKVPNLTTLTLILKFSSSTFAAKIFSKCNTLFRNISNYTLRAADPKLMIFWPYRNEGSTCQYYNYILGRIWSELLEKFPDRCWSKYFESLHDRLHDWELHDFLYCMGCMLLVYLFFCKPDCKSCCLHIAIQ